MIHLLSAVVFLGLAAADEAPPLGKKAQVAITKETPNAGGWYVLEFDYPIEQGDRFRIEAEPVRGAVVRLRAEVWRENGDAFHPFETFPREPGSKVNWTMAKPLPGSKARVRLHSDSTGKFLVRISKVGMPPVADERDETIKKLRAEVAQLRELLAEQKKELEELRKQLLNKKP
jgi:hypothetical protein